MRTIGLLGGMSWESTLTCPGDLSMPVFDTASIHARRAVEWALEGD